MSARPRFFTVKNPRLLCGEHPCPGGDRPVHRARLRSLFEHGVTTFVDLTEVAENEIEPYGQMVTRVERKGLRLAYHRFPIRDTQPPASGQQVEAILDVIDVALLNNEVVYLHCRSGVGRTGTVLALHLVRHGATPREALRLVQAAWAGDPRSAEWPRCPQTDGQCRYVLEAGA